MNKKGFTLVELLAVIAILGLIVTTVSIAVTKIYNDNIKKTMIVQENNIASASRNYLDDYCFSPLDGNYICPKSYDNTTDNRYICLSDLQENEKDNYINKVTYKDEDCKGIIVFTKDDEGGYTKPTTYLYCDYDSKKNKYNYITDESLDISLYPRCNISGGTLPGENTTTKATTTTTKPVDTACTYNGELVQGAEFVSGQYTYRYKQEGFSSASTDLLWTNISTDGWGVQLTDKTSTDAVTSKLCTYINNKPIVSMKNMFRNSQAIAIDLSSFDTSNVTDMTLMFFGSAATTLNLSNFDTSNVTNMRNMFDCSQATTLDLSNFDTSKVTDMTLMFFESAATTLDLSSFDVRNVTDMSYMFYYSQATKIIFGDNFNTSKVTNMTSMFSNSKATVLDLSNFDTRNVTDMNTMFSNSKATKIIFGDNFNTSKVTNMSQMFSSSKVTELDLSNFDTSNVTDMNAMFQFSKIKSLDLSSFNTSKVTNMSYMFNTSEIISIDLSSFDTSNVTNMYGMFNESASLKSIYTSNKFNTSNVTNSSNMFYRCTSLVGGSGTEFSFSYIDKTYARIDGGTSSPGYFTSK